MDQNLSADTISAIVASVTQRGNAPLTEIEAERLLNAIARAQSGVPTGTSVQGSKSSEHYLESRRLSERGVGDDKS